MFQKIAKHRANDASNDVHRPPLPPIPWASFADNPEDAVVDEGAEVEVDQAGQLPQGVLDQVEVVLLHLGRHKWSCSDQQH